MHQLKRDRLSGLAWLRTTQPVLPCKVCGSIRTKLFDVLDFNKFCSVVDPYGFGASGVGVPYFSCHNCDCVFTDFFDDFTPEEFSRFVYNDDYIKVDGEYVSARPERIARQMADILRGFEAKRILDYGSGAGVFAERMRDYGFNVECYDPFSSPTKPTGTFDIVTAFEVIEHSPNPLATFAEMTGYVHADGAIIFSQALQPLTISQIKGTWWYLAPRNGHVTTYSHKTCLTIAKQNGWSFYESPTLFGFAGSDAGREVLSRFGRHATLRSLSPFGDAFYGREHFMDGTEFQWSGSNTITWPVQHFDPGFSLIETRFLMSIDPEFARGCQFRINGNPISTYVRHSAIVAESDFYGEGEISLITPPCRTPREVSGVEDDRPLGLAVAA